MNLFPAHRAIGWLIVFLTSMLRSQLGCREGRRERGDYVNDIKERGVCRSRVSPRGSPWVSPLFSSSPPPLLSLALPLCRMSDPVSAAPPPAWERHEALRRKHNTDRNTGHAMCRPVSQNSPNSLSLSHSPCFSFSLFYSLTHMPKRRQRANSLLGTTHTLLAVLSVLL